jgi:uncharacterized protein (TIGR02145 family)
VAYKNGASNTVSWSPVPTGNVQGICPTGWHLPSDVEWKCMEMNIGMTLSAADLSTGARGTDEGNKMKETGNTHWGSPSAGTNTSGLTFLPGGRSGNSGSLLYFAYVWTAGQAGATTGWWRFFQYNTTDDERSSNFTKSEGMSARCVKD